VQIIDGDKLKEWLYTNQSDYYDVINDRTYIRDHIDEIGCDLDKIELNDNEWLVVRYIKSYTPLKELNAIMEMLQHNVSSKVVAIPSYMDISNYTTKELEKYVEWLNKEIKQRKEY
jgi:hypothetical protein